MAKHGNSEFSPYIYAAFGMIEVGVRGDIDSGYGFARLALRLLDKLNIQKGRVRTLFIVQYQVMGWKEHLGNTLQPLKEAIRSGMETGDPEFICHAANTYIMNSFFCGRELGELEEESLQTKGMIRKFKQLFTLYASMRGHQILLNLRGHSDEPWLLKGESYDIDESLPVYTKANSKSNLLGDSRHLLLSELSFWQI